MSLGRLFADHPASVGESYWEHFRAATGFGVTMIGAGLACLVHAVLPFAFVTRGSETVAQLYQRMVAMRAARAPTRRRARADPVPCGTSTLPRGERNRRRRRPGC
jgi:hypothetical protein